MLHIYNIYGLAGITVPNLKGPFAEIILPQYKKNNNDTGLFEQKDIHIK